MISSYPNKFEKIESYSKENSISIITARQRFAQYGLLRAFSHSRELSSSMVLKGGNALDSFWVPNRSTKDLDFSSKNQLKMKDLESKLSATFKIVQDELGIIFRINNGGQNDDPNPPTGPSFTILRLNIAFALQDEFSLGLQLESGEQLPKGHPNIVPLEVSTDECICESVELDIEGKFKLKLSSIEDIVAEKLRSLLQQVTRDTTRKQDVLDISIILKSKPDIDIQKVSDFLRAKAPVRNVLAKKSEFRNSKIKELAMNGYSSLKETSKIFIEFEEAFADVMTLVESLNIPE